MDVAVLSPQDCLRNPLRTKPTRSNRPYQPNRRKRSPNNSPPPKKPQQLLMGQVKILKRGETLTETAQVKQKQADLDLGSTDRLGPDPVQVKTQIRVEKPSKGTGFYAGSAFFTSPPPSSLPLPAFFIKKSVTKVVDDDATSNLRKMLGINF